MEIYDDKLGIPILFADILRRKVIVKIYKKDTGFEMMWISYGTWVVKRGWPT